MFSPRHCGLFFTPEQVAHAQSNRGQEPFAAAFAALANDSTPDQARPLWLALRFCFLNDPQDGEHAVEALEQHLQTPIGEDSTYLQSVGDTIMAAQAFELLRDHPAFSFVRKAGWLNRFEERINHLSISPYKSSYVENLWMAALVLVGGIVLEREEVFTIGVEVFQQTIDHDIRPQGYITKAIEGGDGGALYRQIASVAALTLMAEAALHVGVDLWNYENRGISVKTAAIYPIYYFYTTQKWRWDVDLATDDVQAWFKQFGGYLEILRTRTGLRDMNPILDDLRPIFSASVGGLTTLTHGESTRRRRLFG